MPLLETRGAASAKGFGFGASTGGPDWSKYAMVPYNVANSNPNKIGFLNITTNIVDYDVSMPITSSGTCLIRMGNYLLVGNAGSFWMLDIQTGSTVQSQTTPIGALQGDFFKFATDKFGILTKLDSALQVATFQVNANGTTTQIAYNNSVASLGAAQGFNGPMGAAIVTCDSKGMFDSFSGSVAFRVIYSYVGGDTQTLNGNFTVSANGTSISLANSSQTGENFSRPSASSGGFGWAIVYDMDHSSYFMSTGTQRTITGITATDAGTPTNFRGCGTTQSQAFLNIGYDGAGNAYVRRMVSNSATTILNFSMLSGGPFYGTMQLYNGGAFFAYNAASGTAVYQTYSTATGTFSGEFVPSGINGYVNKNGTVYGTYNY